MKQPRTRRLIEADPAAIGLVSCRIQLGRGTGEALDGPVLEDEDALHLLSVDDDRLDDAWFVGRCLAQERRRPE